MKQWLLFIFLALIVFPSVSWSQNHDGLLAEASPQGFKSVTAITCYKDSRKPNKKEYLYFDEEGKLRKRTFVGGELAARFTSSFSSKPETKPTQYEEYVSTEDKVQRLEWTHAHSHASWEQYDSVTHLKQYFVYDSSTNVLSKYVFLGNKLITKQFKYFDAGGRLFRVLEKMDFMEKERQWTFDRFGRKRVFRQCITHTFEGRSRKEIWKKYIYNDKDRLWKVYYADSGKNQRESVSYVYDSKGFIIESNTYIGKNHRSQTRYFYEYGLME